LVSICFFFINLDIKKITIQVGILVPHAKKSKSKVPEFTKKGKFNGKNWTLKNAQLAMWRKEAGRSQNNWQNKTGKGITSFKFSIKEFTSNKEYKNRMEDFYYLIQYSLIAGNKKIIKSSYYHPLFNNKFPSITPFSTFNTVIIDPESLSFDKLNKKSTLKALKIKIKVNNKITLNKTIAPKRNNISFLSPFSILHKKDSKLIIDITSFQKDQKSKKTVKINWSENGKIVKLNSSENKKYESNHIYLKNLTDFK
jgi:hypothetical protein